MKTRNGVLGLETARSVMVTFLVLAVTGIAVILSLVSITDGVGNSIDNVVHSISVNNETGIYINSTGTVLNNWNSTWGTITLVDAFNYTDGISIGLGNITLTQATGKITNATTTNWVNATVSYTASYTQDTGRSDRILGNVSGGIDTFFGSTGTIFSILIVVVIILAISIIIWAVGRFGQRTEREAVNL